MTLKKGQIIAVFDCTTLALFTLWFTCFNNTQSCKDMGLYQTQYHKTTGHL